MITSAPSSTPDQRVAQGKAARAVLRRGASGQWDPSRRSADALQVILGQNRSRDTALLPVRYQRMALSPWNYFRGAAAVMASDLATAPNTGLDVQLCGDAHVLNFGLWATPERNLAFDLRDFDETLPGPFEWDVKRLVTSLVVATRENGLAQRTADQAVAAALVGYRRRMASYVNAHELDIWYDRVDVGQLLTYFVPEHRSRLDAFIQKKASHRTSQGAYRKLTEIVDGRRRITEDPPFRQRIAGPGTEALVTDVVESYRQSLPPSIQHLLGRYHLVDFVRQVVGVGTVGMRVHLVLLEGRAGDDPLFLQVKQATASVYERYLQPSAYANHGARVINGKRQLQSATDIFAGWTTVGEYDYYVRQFRDMKVIPDSTRIAPVLVEFASACGEAMARSHARSGDAAAISGYIGKGECFDRALTSYAHAYADQNDVDHAQLVAAIAAGAVSAAQG